MLSAILGISLWAGGGTGCLAVEGEHILARDLAARHAVFSALAPEEAIALSPYAGATRVFSSEELARLARRRALPEAILEPVCFVYRTQPIAKDFLLSSLRASLGMGAVDIEVVDHGQWPVPAGELSFPRARQARPDGQGVCLFNGMLQYAGRRTMSVWVKARVNMDRPALVALEPIAAGQTIGRNQVGTDQRPRLGVGEGMVERVEDAVGKAARRAIRAGSPIYGSNLTEPVMVERGDQVQVEVRSGAARLSLPGQAEGAGRKGEKVLIRSGISGKRFTATILDAGKVRVETDPGSKGAQRENEKNIDGRAVVGTDGASAAKTDGAGPVH